MFTVISIKVQISSPLKGIVCLTLSRTMYQAEKKQEPPPKKKPYRQTKQNKNKNTTLVLPKSSLKLISSKCDSFWLTTSLLCLMNEFFNKQSAFLWVPTCPPSRRLVLLFVRSRLHTRLHKKNEMQLVRSFELMFRYIEWWCPFTK